MPRAHPSEPTRERRAERDVVAPPRADAAIARLAAAQHGVVSAAQLRGLGVSRSAVSRRAARGLVHPVHRGVYAVGHPAIGRKGRWTAALLAVGSSSVLSHFAAADLWELLVSGGERIDVTTVRRGGRLPGLHVHRVGSVHPCEVARVDCRSRRRRARCWTSRA